MSSEQKQPLSALSLMLFYPKMNRKEINQHGAGPWYSLVLVGLGLHPCVSLNEADNSVLHVAARSGQLEANGCDSVHLINPGSFVPNAPSHPTADMCSVLL